MWKSLIAIKIETYWKFTPLIEGTYFRLRHIEPPKTPVGWIGQAEAIPNTSFHQLFAIQRLNGLSFYETIEYIKPPIFETRKLAFRQESKSPNNWIIEVEVSDVMPIWNPSGPATPVTSSTANATSVPVSTTSVLLLAANTNRVEVLIYNTSTKSTLYLGYGTAATVGGGVPVAPGGYFELPADYTGAINGIWNVADVNGAAKVVEFIT